MAVFGRSPQPRRRMPRYGAGWATGSYTDVGVLWRHLVIAYAPFLGPTANPTKKLYGSRFRPGQASFSGGRASSSIWGPAWEHTATSDSVTIADSAAQSILASGGASSYTTILGYRKTDLTFRISAAYGYSAFGGVVAARVPTNNEHLIVRYNVGNGEASLDVDLTGNTWLEDHVYAASAGPYGKLAYVDGRLVGTSAAPTAGLSEGGSLILGSGADGGQIGDLAVYGFFYMFSRQLPDEVVSALSADPGLLFRPISAAIGKGVSATIVDMAAGLAGSGAVAANLAVSQEFAAALAGAGAVGANAGLLVGMASDIPGSAALSGTLGTTSPLAASIFGSAAVTADLAGAPEAFLGEAGGLGAEPLGDPLGSGGPIHVVRARAVEGQTVRVVFDTEPLHQGSAGTTDSLNPSNYSFAITGGTGTGPLPVGVKARVIEGPAAGVESSQWGVDVQTDQQLIVGLTYEVTVAGRVQSISGGSMGGPYSVPFYGVVRLEANLPPPRPLSNLDLGYSLLSGAFIVGDSGDIDPQGGLDGYKKRVVRRLTTPKNAWAHLPGYGLLPKLQAPASVREILSLKADAVQQISEEPETASVDIQVTFANNVLTMNVRARTRTGLVLTAAVATNVQTGNVVVS